MTIRSKDDGMTLVELIVAVVVGSLVLGGLAMMFMQGLRSQQDTTERDALTGAVNAALASITESVRDSVDVHETDGGGRVDAKVLLADGVTWKCRAWAASGGELRYAESSTLITSDASTWTTMLGGLDASGAPSGPFKVVDRELSVSLKVSGKHATVAVTGGATPQTIKTGGPSCWSTG